MKDTEDGDLNTAIRKEADITQKKWGGRKGKKKEKERKGKKRKGKQRKEMETRQK